MITNKYRNLIENRLLPIHKVDYRFVISVPKIKIQPLSGEYEINGLLSGHTEWHARSHRPPTINAREDRDIVRSTL